MSSLSQSSWLCSLHTTKTIQPSILIIPFHPQIKSLKFSSFTVSNSNDQSSLTPISSNESEQTLEESKPNRVKLALEKAREYKKSLQLDDNQEISNDPVAESAGIVSGSGGLVSGDESGDVKEVPEAVRIAMEKAREYQNNKENVGDVKSKVENVNSPGEDDGAEKAIPEVVRRAMEKAKEYKENKGVMSNVENENPPGDMKGGDMEVPEAVRIAMGKANEYKKNKGVIDNSSSIVEDSKLIGSEGGNASNMGSRNIEQNTEKKGDLKISSIDFVGLNFSDKKTGRALPAGLVPVSNPFPDDDLPEVEILVGDASKFGEAASSESKTPSQEEGSDLYKPKISTWGMFPRPNNISKTFGGGRNIRPGEALETPEDKAAKQARTRQLIAAYKRKMGLNIDPKLKAECEKSFRH
ncbi:unnamed protein product [Amaranthus hypochondriacus]